MRIFHTHDLITAGTIYMSARGHVPPEAQLAYDRANAAHGRRRQRPWLELVPPPPGMPAECFRRVHRKQLHTAVAKALGKRRSDFCAGLIIDLYGEGVYRPTPHLVTATARFRLPNRRDDDRIDLAVHECNAEFYRYYAEPVAPELAHMVFDAYARHARYKTILTCGGLMTDDWATFGVMRPIR